MPRKYTRDQFWELYQDLPQELKEAVFDEKIGDNILDICEKNNVGDHLGEIVDLSGQVLIGLLPPEDFQKALESDLKIKEVVAEEVSQKINRFVFYPLKPALEKIYRIESSEAGEEKAEKPSPIAAGVEIPSSPAKDTYREPTE